MIAPVDPFTGLEAARLGLYLHFPYCLARCPYCDFAVSVSRSIPHERYAAAVLSELDRRLLEWPSLRGRQLDSVFIGGGTPSLWAPDEVARVLEGIRARFAVPEGAELSLEANPEIADAGRYAAYARAGINRLSLGVQSFDAATLKALGRAHDARQARAAFDTARAAGFAVVSLDLIYGVQGEPVPVAIADAEQAAALGPEHVSAYALTVEREVLAVETQLARGLRKGELQLPSDDAQVAMSRGVERALFDRGLRRYEISNFAREGLHSRHNALYWTGGEYLGLGVGAVGLLQTPAGAVRTFNLRGSEGYLSAVERGVHPESSREAVSREELFEERLAMGLRLATGVDVAALAEAYGVADEARLRRAEQYVRDGFAEWSGPRLRLTPRGLDVHTELAARLI